jgi:hypothetical protein
MQLVKHGEVLKTEMEFVISCDYFNNLDERTQTTDLIINLGSEKLISSTTDLTEIISAA